jgi:RNA polymerase sigma factor (sigma-70 family)
MSARPAFGYSGSPLTCGATGCAAPVAQARALEGEELSGAQPPEKLAAGREELGRALEAMNALPPRQREVLYLSACEGLATREIAEVLGITADAVKANLSLARKKLREQLQDLFPDTARFE